MSFKYDRLYGRLTFPPIVEELLDCPGLLRLREIGMGNVRFLAFPSFSAATRYEHSLGVCHLADLASKSLSLCRKDRIELMIAALYHDITTPPFAHATEELLASHYGFDHEKHFHDLITGRATDLGGQYAQIFGGKALKLPRLCQGPEARSLQIDLFRIPALVFGQESERLSSVICGDVDLDNIDNVVRAASAMGIREADGDLAEALAKSFISYKGKEIALSGTAHNFLEKWKTLRATLYGMILCSIDDFALQTMLKHALRYLIETDDESIRLHEEDWKLTEQQLIERIEKHNDASRIYRRMQLRDLYDCLALVWITGRGVLKYVENDQNQRILESSCEKAFSATGVVNYYEDKRRRDIKRPLVFFGETRESTSPALEEPGLLLGFFTPVNRKQFDKTTKKRRPLAAQRREFIDSLAEQLPSHFSLHQVRTLTRRGYPQLIFGDRLL